MDDIKIERDFLEELLDDEIALWNIANNRYDNKPTGCYQRNIDRINFLLNGGRT